MATRRQFATHDIKWQRPERIPDERLAAFVIEQYRAAKARRATWEQRAAERLAWAAGHQQQRYSAEVRDLNNVRDMYLEGVPDRFRFPVMINMIRPALLQRIATLLSVPANLYALPVSNEDSDVEAAQVQTQLLQYMWHSPTGLRRQLAWLLWMLFCTGVMFGHPHWDPTVGEVERFKPEASDGRGRERRKGFVKRLAERSGRPESSFHLEADGSIELPAGEVRVSWATGFDVSEPEFATDIAHADWLIATELRSMESLRDQYGSAVDDVSPNEHSGDFLSGYRSMYGPGSESEGQGEDVAPTSTKAELVPVHRLWRPKRPWCSQGVLAVVADSGDGHGVVLHKGPNPYPHGEIPYVRVGEQPGTTFRPSCAAEDGMNIQEARNRTRSQISAGIHSTIAGKIMVEDGIDFPDNSFDSEQRIVRVTGGALNKIQPWAPPQIPAEAFRLDDMYRRDFQDVMGVHDSSMGRAESSSQSGRHAALLRANDEKAVSVAREEVEAALSAIGAQALWIWHGFVGTERTVSYTGQGMLTKVLAFKGSTLFRQDRSPSPASWNVRVVMGPDDTIERVVEKLGGLKRAGLLSGQGIDPNIVTRLMGMAPSVEGDEDEHHRNNARAENYQILEGEPVFCAIGDRDDLHLEEHDRFTTTAAYRQAVRKNRKLADAFEAHRIEHLNQVAGKEMAVVEAQQRVKQIVQERLRLEAEREAQRAQARAAAAAGKDERGMFVFGPGFPGGNGTRAGPLAGSANGGPMQTGVPVQAGGPVYVNQP